MSEKKMVKFSFNGKEMTAPEGYNLLQAALDHGVKVAHYCYHQGLSIAGVCRMCMVTQEGNPRPFPACNATVVEGGKFENESPKIKSAVKSTLEFHLVNHPLDCPVCDQAGECSLQEYYMLHGLYDSNVTDKKVHKDKVQDIGRDVMLDAERCILCSRCVRFTTEVTKTNEMGVMNRGDHCEITANSNLVNGYAQCLVDICPVGALTSKDFRFKQRVWFLNELKTTCIGCETGCSVSISYNDKGAFRVKPVFNQEINGHWMCDEGRKIYKHLTGPTRLQSVMERREGAFFPTSEDKFKEEIAGLTPKYILSTFLTNEEYEAFFNSVPKSAEVALYALPPDGEEFDGILKRGERNPNIRGAMAAFMKHERSPAADALMKLLNGLSKHDVVMLTVPEMLYNHDHFKTLLSKMGKASKRVALTSSDALLELSSFEFLLPIPTFAEKEGTIINYKEMKRALAKSYKDFGNTGRNVATWTQI